MRTILYFQNPVFNDGVNISVRRGTKWNTEAQKGVVIADTANPVGAIAIVDIETRVLCFRDLRDEDLKDQHDPECRTVSGLLDVMKKVYRGFDEREIVTLVRFVLPK